MKKSKILRKRRNELTANSADPHREPRTYRGIPPTFGRAAHASFHVGTCERKVGEAQVKRGRLKRKQTVAVPCGGRLIARLGKGSRRRVYCESCRERRNERRRFERMEKRIARFSALRSVEREQKHKLLSKFRRRAGAR